MKKQLQILAAVSLTVSVNAQKPDFKAFQNLEVEKLETVCDCASAFEQGTEIEIYFLNNAKKYKYKQEKESKQVMEWEDQMRFIQEHCVRYKKHKPADIKKCGNLQLIVDLRDRTREEFDKHKK